MTPKRRDSDKCFIRRMWDRFTPYIAAGAWVPVSSRLGTIMWWGGNFVRDTQALPQKMEHEHLVGNLTTARLDRVDSNIQKIMEAMRIHPVPKSESEVMAERLLEDDSDSDKKPR